MGRVPGDHPHTHGHLPKSASVQHTASRQSHPEGGSLTILSWHPCQGRKHGRGDRDKDRYGDIDKDLDLKENLTLGGEGIPIIAQLMSIETPQNGSRRTK